MSNPFSPDQSRVTWGLTFVRPLAPSWRYGTRNGRTYYVSPAGRDTWSGSQFSPFLTIKRALELALPGDIVYLNAGTYSEQIVPVRGGAEGAPIILSCAPNALGLVHVSLPTAMVQADPRAPVVYIGKTVRTDWLIINGLVLSGPLGKSYAPTAEHFSACGVIVRNGSSNITLQNLVVTSFVHCGIKEMGDGGTNITVRGCLCGGNGTDGQDHGVYFPSDENIVDGCICWGNSGYGVHLYPTPKNCCVANSILGKNGGGLLLGGRDASIHNNVIFGNRNEGIFYFRGGCVENDVVENIITGNGTDCAYDNGGGKLGDPTGNRDDYNDYWPGQVPPTFRAFNNAGSHSFSADPKFVSAANGDFHLAADSPCRGRGIPNPPDIGPFA